VFQQTCERIVLLFCFFGNPLSYFVGVNGQPRPGDDAGSPRPGN
jgi:hypothetical protein